MALRLSPDMLAAAYTLLATSQPFDGWNLPDADDMIFQVVRSRALCGCYWRPEQGRHAIAISSGSVGQISTLVRIMAHEMVHLHLGLTGMDRAVAAHGAAFRKCADRVCRVHGFDPKFF